MRKDVAAEKEFGDINAVNDTVAKIINIDKTVVTAPLGKRKREDKNKAPDQKSSIFLFVDLTLKEIRRQTGFKDLFCLLSYIATICGCDMDIMSKTCSSLI